MKENTIIAPQLEQIGPKIAVVGVGGAGENAVDNMIRSGLTGVSFLVCNTDAQALGQSLCPEAQRVLLGYGVTQGLGAGSSPEVGRAAAEESIEEVMNRLRGVHMVFITAGMGGGTGTGASSVIAKAAKESGILTVGVVTKPFHFEGIQRMRVAEKGIEWVRDSVDTLLVIPNQNLFRLATQNTTFIQAFAMADEVLYSGVRTFTDLMIKPGLVNSDFADICTVMRDMKGKAMMGTGEASGDNRAIEAAEKAIACLLLDDVSIYGAQAVLINITGGPSLTLYDVDEAIGRIKQEVETDIPGRNPTQIIFGATFDESMENVLRVSVVATGIQDPELERKLAANTSGTDTGVYGHASASAGYPSLGSRHEDYAFEDNSGAPFLLREEQEPFGFSPSEGSMVSGPGAAAESSSYGAAQTPEEPQKTNWFDRWRRRRAGTKKTMPEIGKTSLSSGHTGAGQSVSDVSPVTPSQGLSQGPERQYSFTSYPSGFEPNTNEAPSPYHKKTSLGHPSFSASDTSAMGGKSFHPNAGPIGQGAFSGGSGPVSTPHGHGATGGSGAPTSSGVSAPGQEAGPHGRQESTGPHFSKTSPQSTAPQEIPKFLRPLRK